MSEVRVRNFVIGLIIVGILILSVTVLSNRFAHKTNVCSGSSATAVNCVQEQP